MPESLLEPKKAHLGVTMTAHITVRRAAAGTSATIE